MNELESNIYCIVFNVMDFCLCVYNEFYNVDFFLNNQLEKICRAIYKGGQRWANKFSPGNTQVKSIELVKKWLEDLEVSEKVSVDLIDKLTNEEQ